MSTLQRYDWSIADTVNATGLADHYIRRALLDGSLDGLVAPRLLRTDETAVKVWLESLKVKWATAAPTVKTKARRKG